MDYQSLAKCVSSKQNTVKIMGNVDVVRKRLSKSR